jgi:hypothetical protein
MGDTATMTETGFPGETTAAGAGVSTSPHHSFAPSLAYCMVASGAAWFAAGTSLGGSGRRSAAGLLENMNWRP